MPRSHHPIRSALALLARQPGFATAWGIHGWWVAAGCAVLVTACSDLAPDGAASTAPCQQGKRTFAASSTTRTELGVDQWEISRQDESATIRAAMAIGYSAEGHTLQQIRLRRTAGENEGWLEFSVVGQPPAVVRFALHADGTVSQEGPNEVHDNASARETVVRFGSDLQNAVDSSGSSTNSLRVLTDPLLGAPANLLPGVPATPSELECFNACLASIPDLYGLGASAYCRELRLMGVC
jgi:hypothetical protein